MDGREGLVRNVSASGVYFLTDAPLETGQPVSFTLQLGSFPGGAIAVDCKGHVVRVEEKGTKKGIGAAISSFVFHKRHGPSGESSD